MSVLSTARARRLRKVAEAGGKQTAPSVERGLVTTSSRNGDAWPARPERTSILVIDDGASLGPLVAGLASRGYCVTAMTHGNAAMLRIAAAAPDLILIGAATVDLNGLKLCGRLLRSDELGEVPLIFMVPPGQTGEALASFALGVTDCVSKSVDPRLLQLRIARHLRPGVGPQPATLGRRDMPRLACPEPYKWLTDHASDAQCLLFVACDEVRFLQVNTAFADMVGMAAGAIVGRTSIEVLGTTAGARLRGACHVCALGGEDEAVELVFEGGKGRTVLELTLRLYIVPGSGEARLAGIGRDVEALRAQRLQLALTAARDPLTGLRNAHAFHRRLAVAVARAEAAASSMGLLLLDMDNFRDINQIAGRLHADSLLKACAVLLRRLVGNDAVIARTGCNEFAVLVDAADGGAALAKLARRLLRLLGRPTTRQGLTLVTTASVGLAMYPRDGHTADLLLTNADAALLRAKARGGNCCHVFSAEMGRAIRRRLAIGAALRGALRRDEFALHYQARVARAGGEVAGVEALIRWQAGAAGAIAPGEFIPVAEQNGLILQIGEWVLQAACRQAKQWLERLPAPVPVAVNLSARQFREGDLVRTVAAALAATGLPPHLLELELTESMLMHSVTQTQATLNQLRSLGVSLAADDFGTGYSSLSYLKTFALDFLKIDRSFVQGMAVDPRDREIVRAVIAMAQSLGLRTIAEGVETAEQMAALWALGCDEIQGYYVCRPLAAGPMTAFLEERQAGKF